MVLVITRQGLVRVSGGQLKGYILAGREDALKRRSTVGVVEAHNELSISRRSSRPAGRASAYGLLGSLG
jgi:hypothetical protein